MKTTGYETSIELFYSLKNKEYKFNSHFRLDAEKDVISSSEYDQGQYTGTDNDLVMTYTFIELWDMLPNTIPVKGTDYLAKKTLSSMELGDCAQCFYVTHYGEVFGLPLPAPVCNSIARLVIWCIENDHPLNLKK